MKLRRRKYLDTKSGNPTVGDTMKRKRRRYRETEASEISLNNQEIYQGVGDIMKYASQI